ncbi:alpha-keto acid decarboxylase family protein [Nakamurella flavida]|uniref:Alpha-keto-acid decarboxylase n=1 Tax=Nakamurella flavida TaxID=363630 RepID=A0A938YMV5_9ACTN|nr:thiamine pyrophosphate-binding protein [Nakamurella flavida]MBM9478179.1 alpha-keto acid decarboxylase family protein [Nakamurella flavida]MDP9778599.1 indolepyruvate decarboxylase [Nakamurella flavida]
MADSLTSGYTVADYLMDRLVEIGVDRVFGVPGDFTLGLLDHVTAHRGLTWTGCANELNAGYAADGYGRMRGMAALCTTFGVGELSAINALAGSYAEHVPVIEIVGAPATSAQAAHRILHHSLGDGVFTHFMDLHADVTCARASLTAADAEAEIDRVLLTARDRRLPGYLLLPVDVAGAPATPPAGALPPPQDATDPTALDAFTRAAARLLQDVPNRDISVLGGVLVHRTGGSAAFAGLITAGGLDHATTLWGKSLFDESDPTYRGIYAGAASDPAVRGVIEDAGALVVAGVQFTDLTSGFFSQHLPRARTVELGAGSASVGDELFEPVTLPAALRALTALIAARGEAGADPTPEVAQPVPAADDRAQVLGQRSLWDQVAGFVRPGDIVVADQGTAFYGMATHRLPTGVTFLGQPLWASIGYSVPAVLGACLAGPGRRGVLLVGDGAAQMTLTELATVLRHGLPAVVIVVDNDGYTIERAIHGPDEPYNDIARLDWAALPATFGPDADARGVRVDTVGELADALADATAHPGRFTLIQAVVPRDDIPPLLDTLARAAAGANRVPG